MDGLAAVWENVELYIGTAESSGTWTYAQLCAGIESATPNFNENNIQSFFLCGEGFAHNAVTGGAPAIAVSGKRVAGDAAQDYIAGLQWKLGKDRESSMKLVDTLNGKQVVCPCVIGDIVSFGGNATDLNAFSCTLRMNGAPTVTTAA